MTVNNKDVETKNFENKPNQEHNKILILLSLIFFLLKLFIFKKGFADQTVRDNEL